MPQHDHLAVRPHDKMRDVLMNPDAPGPKEHYYMVRGGSDMRNVTIMEVGTVGGEYIKTYGHYHIGDLQETYWFVFGEGIVLKQKLVEENGVPQPDRVAEFIAQKVQKNDSAHMPPGYGHLILNTGKTYMVMLDDSPVDFGGKKDEVSMPGHADYEMVKKMRGFAYYVVEHNGQPALVKNKLYKEILKEDLGGMQVVG